MKGIYLIVEGKGEKYLYPKWVEKLENDYQFIQDYTELGDDLIYIIGGAGYPGYFKMIRNGILDVCSIEYKPTLVISVDCEEVSFSEKTLEITNIIADSGEDIDYAIVLQDCCLETWALGNESIIRRNPHDPTLTEYKKFYDVTKLDPEEMPSIGNNMNRAQFSYDYLNKALNDRRYTLSHTKSKPKTLAHEKYLERIIKRYDKGHIQSFGAFLDVFSRS